MKFLIWKRQVLEVLKQRFTSIEDWESWCDWKEYFINGCSPIEAVEQAFAAHQLAVEVEDRKSK